MSDENVAEVLTDLQTRLAFQEQTILELNDIVASQQQQIDRLQLQVKAVYDKLNGLEDVMDKSTDNQPIVEKPPHY